MRIGSQSRPDCRLIYKILTFPKNGGLTLPQRPHSVPPPRWTPGIFIMEKHTRGVELKNGESVDRALKRLKTKLDTEGILEEMRRRRAHESTITRAIRKARTAPKRNKVRWRFQSEGQVATAAAAAAARNAE